MKIGIDVQTTKGHKTGFGFYVENLVRYLKLIDNSNKYLEFSPKTKHDLSAPQRFLWDQFGFPGQAKRKKIDILHQPCYSAPLFFYGKIVLTIHDIISVKYGADLPFFAKMYFSRFMPATYNRADAIITDSLFTKKDLIEIGLKSEKIHVIPLAVSGNFKPIKNKNIIQNIKNKYKLGDRYILNVGSLNPRKNVLFLIEVFAKIHEKYPDINLVISGEGWYKQKLIEKINELSLSKNIIFTGYIDESDKTALYSGAEIFLFPSLYEGFGFPPLEAMACGVPVVCSNASSLPEVVGEAGILLNPKNHKEWIDCISLLINDDNKKSQLSQKSLERAKHFTWEKCAKQTLDVYKSLYENNN